MKFWCFCLIDQIGIKYIELITLYNLWGRVILIIVCLVVFIPFISYFDSIEVLRLSWRIHIHPIIMLLKSIQFFSSNTYPITDINNLIEFLLFSSVFFCFCITVLTFKYRAFFLSISSLLFPSRTLFRYFLCIDILLQFPISFQDHKK